MNLLFPTRVATAMLAIFGTVFGVGALGLGLWQTDMPGPGLLPFATALLLLPLIYFVLREPVPDETPFKSTALKAVVLTCGFAAVVPYTGFALGTFMLVVLWVRFFEKQSWVRAGLVGGSLVVAGIIVFSVLLHVPIPLQPVWP